MKIKSLQKTTLIDYPGKVACTIFTWGCNFKCGFCHNPELVIENQGKDISQEAVLDFLEKRKKYLDGVCITGGEPLIDIDLELLKKIKNLGYAIKIDTNGCFPEKLQELIASGLVDFIAMDIKGSKEKYGPIVNSDVNLGKIEQSMKIISDFPNYEFRTTILGRYHNEIEIKNMIEWLKQATGKAKLKKFGFQGFKNMGKFVDIQFEKEPEPTKQELELLKAIIDDNFENVEIRA